MMRSLFTAASGMIAQQTNVDVISNNLANVNTSGYKTSSTEFKSLLYQTLQSRSTSANGDQKPIPAQVGTGVRTSSMTTHFTQGSTIASANPFAFAIEGEGLFGVRNSNGETIYTRNGNFLMSTATGGGFMLCTTDGYPVLSTDGDPIEFDSSYDASKISITGDGTVCYLGEDNNPHSIGIRVGLFQFTNPSGLEKIGSTCFKETEASGEAIEESSSEDVKKSKLFQGYLEASNVQVADEMVNLIIAQRAYEMNSKAIQASDEMLGQANQLRR